MSSSPILPQPPDPHFQRIFDSTLMGILFTDYEGRVFEANDAFLSMVGYSREELAAGAVRWDALTPSDWMDVSLRAVAELKDHGFASAFEKEFLRKDGSRVSALVGSTRIDDKGWNVTFALDITERKRAESNLRFLADASRILSASLDIESVLKALADQSVPAVADWCAVDLLQPDGSVRRIAVAHRDPEIVRLTHELERHFPVTLESPGVIARVLRTGRPEVYLDVPEGTLAAASRGEAHLRQVTKTDVRSILVMPMIARGRTLGSIALLATGSRRRFEEGDLHVAEELARRAALSVENARLYQEAQSAVQLRDEFLSIASHELKTPLTPLSLKLQSLARDLARDSPSTATERRRKDVEVLQRQVRRLSDLVTDLLDVSRIAAGKLSLQLEPVDLSVLVREVALRFDPEALRAGSSIEVAGDVGVDGTWDRLRLEQVLSNLLSNAVKYGAGKPIQVEVWSEGEIARVSVADGGIGIDPEVMPRIFERFERGVSQRHYGGLGLGLFITRQIVEAFDGTITAESQPGRGSRFVVTLPRR